MEDCKKSLITNKMSTEHNHCSKEISTNNTNVNTDESIIERSPSQTPVKKKLKKIKHRTKNKKHPLKMVENSETDSLEQLVKEFEKNEIQSLSIYNETFCKGEDPSQSKYNAVKNESLGQKNKTPRSLHNNDKGQVHEKCSKNNRLETSSQPLKTLEEEIKFRNIVKNVDDERNTTRFEKYQQNMRSDYWGIAEPIQKTLSKNCHNLYVFYLINEVLAFTPNDFPKNSCVQLIGQFKFDEQRKSHFICRPEKELNYQIKINLREVFLKPNHGERIILFGVICFESYTPVVVVKFFQQSTVDYHTYVELMLRLRTTVPRENFNMVCVNNEDFKLEETLVEECYNKEFFNGLTQKLKGDELESNDLSDSTLCAFLDDISFENL